MLVESPMRVLKKQADTEETGKAVLRGDILNNHT